jgi:hypothetical protein
MAGTISRSLGMPGVHVGPGDHLCGLYMGHPKVFFGGLVFENPHYLSPDEYRSSKS